MDYPWLDCAQHLLEELSLYQKSEIRVCCCSLALSLESSCGAEERLGFLGLPLSQSSRGLGPLDLIGFGTGRKTEIPFHICRVLSSLQSTVKLMNECHLHDSPLKCAEQIALIS